MSTISRHKMAKLPLRNLKVNFLNEKISFKFLKGKFDILCLLWETLFLGRLGLGRALWIKTLQIQRVSREKVTFLTRFLMIFDDFCA